MCLNRITLERFAGGDLSCDDEAAAETHLASCRCCAEALAAIRVDKELIARIRDVQQSRAEIAPALSMLQDAERQLSTTLFDTR